jgi:hypothetical protein
MHVGSDGSQRDDPAFTEKAVINDREVVVEFAHHAHQRMRQRGILVEEVIACLRNPMNGIWKSLARIGKAWGDTTTPADACFRSSWRRRTTPASSSSR